MEVLKESINSFIFRKTKLRRTVFFVIADGMLLSFALYLSFYLRFDGNIDSQYLDRFFHYLLVFLSIKFAVFTGFRLYRMSWSYVSFYEIINIVKANTVSFFLILGVVFMLRPHTVFTGFPRSIPLIDFVFSLVLITMLRSSKRVYLQSQSSVPPSNVKRTLIVGAGNAGEQIVRDMRRQIKSAYLPVGFVDDDAMKHGIYIHGIKVFGSRNDIPRLVQELNVDIVLISIPSASSRDIRQILDHVRKSDVGEVKTIPGLHQLVKRYISLADIKPVRIEDIIGREQVSIDHRIVNNFIYGKKLLITGAGGSIGSELVRQALAFKPEKIIALDIDETELHHLEIELGPVRHSELVTLVADIRDRHKIQDVFNKHRPEVVFHAAAYKHVPIMEKYPEEAVSVNILGTKIIAQEAVASGTKEFVLVSTDKAVRPINVMGATKRVAEKVVNALNARGETRFTSVRFGNVVGSRGSVVEIFKEQIRKGVPLTVTHRDMKRYFMSIPEACILILQAGAMGSGGEVFHLDMGEQIKITDIARELVLLHGLEPDIDVPIVFTGIREGEKLHEDLITDSEFSSPTEHQKIFRVRDNVNNYAHVLGKVMLFEDIIKRRQWAWIRNLLHDIVPSYNPSYATGEGGAVKNIQETKVS